MKDKRGIVWQTLIPWIIGVAILFVIGVGVYITLTDRAGGAGDFISSILRFGR
jgi:hypothetical protein